MRRKGTNRMSKRRNQNNFVTIPHNSTVLPYSHEKHKTIGHDKDKALCKTSMAY